MFRWQFVCLLLMKAWHLPTTVKFCGCHIFSWHCFCYWNFSVQNQNMLLVTRQKDIHSPGPGKLVPIPHKRSKLSNTILYTFSRDEWRFVPIPDGLGEEATFININISNGDLKCWRMMIPTESNHGDKVFGWYTGFTFQTFVKQYDPWWIVTSRTRHRIFITPFLAPVKEFFFIRVLPKIISLFFSRVGIRIVNWCNTRLTIIHQDMWLVVKLVPSSLKRSELSNTSQS